MPDALARKLDRRNSDRRLQVEQQKFVQEQQREQFGGPQRLELGARDGARDGAQLSDRRGGAVSGESEASKLAAIRQWIAADGARLAAARYASAAASAAAEGLPGLVLGHSPSAGAVVGALASPSGRKAKGSPGGRLADGQTMLLPGGTLRLGHGAGLDSHWPDAAGEGAHESARKPMSPRKAPLPSDSAAADDREALAYGELLQTLQELMQTGGSPIAKDCIFGGEDGGEVEEDVFSDAQERAEPFSVDAANGAELIPEDAALAGGGEDSAEALRQKLVRILGSGCFEKAHARLQKVVEEEDDDALVADIQAILGPERLDKLPMILKLIYLEGGGLF
jgi:hypothetical protein